MPTPAGCIPRLALRGSAGRGGALPVLQGVFPMRTGTWRMLALLALSGVIVLAGCSNRPKLAEVKGTVTLKGKPLPKVVVEFIPDALTGQRSTGTTDENGHYTLVCDDQRPGAIIGPHRVLLHDTM